MGGFNAAIPLQAFPDNEYNPINNAYKLAQLRAAGIDEQTARLKLADFQRQQQQQANVRNAARSAIKPQTGTYTEPSVTLGGNRPALYSAPGNFKGMISPGNIDIAHRPDVQNADGTHSSVRSVSFNIDGKEVLIPTVSEDGRIMSNQEALQQFRKTGKHLGIFDSPDSATAYAQALHEQQAGQAPDMPGQQFTLPSKQVTVQGPAQFDRNAFVANLNQSDPLAGMDFQNQFAQQDAKAKQEQAALAKALQEADTAHLANIHQHESAISDSLAPVVNNPQEWERVAGQLIDSGIASPQLLPRQYPGQDAAMQTVKRSMSAKDQAAQEFQNRQQQETTRHNTATEALTANSQLLTKRGQDLVNQRAIEKNKIDAAKNGADSNTVDMIGQGKLPLSRVDYLLSKNPEVMNEVAAKYPDFDLSKVKSYADTYKSFTGSGKDAMQLSAGAVAIRHLAQLKRINDENPAEVRIPGTKANKAYQNLLDTVADELVTFYGEPKTNEAMHSKKATLGGLTNRDAAILEQASAMGVKFDELEQKWKNAAPSPAYQAPMPGITKEAIAARAELDPTFAKRSTGGSVQVTDPNGGVHTFPNQQAADNFKKAAGIQ